MQGPFAASLEVGASMRVGEGIGEGLEESQSQEGEEKVGG